MKYTGMTLDSIREQYRPRAEKQVKMRLALETIADLEKLEASEDDINAEYEKIAGAYGVELAKVKELIASEDLARDVVVGKAMTLVKDNAVIK